MTTLSDETVRLSAKEIQVTTKSDNNGDKKNQVPASLKNPSKHTVVVAAKKVGILPSDTAASRRQRQRASWWFRQLLKLSQCLDLLQTPYSYVNYQCVWWKAISGGSSLPDGGLAYDLLPPVTRWAVAPLWTPLCPRFDHANVELRTQYLDSAMERAITNLEKKP